MSKTLFSHGRIVATPGVLDLDIDLMPYLRRHLSGDWGDLSDEDKRENDFSVTRRLRILSAYNTPRGRIWILTEADRSATTFLLPAEY